jgi:hypothetical protein
MLDVDLAMEAAIAIKNGGLTHPGAAKSPILRRLLHYASTMRKHQVIERRR